MEQGAVEQTWQHQIRLYLTERGAALLRRAPEDEAVAPLLATLRQHGATLVSQLDAFEAFLADPAQADTPLGRWTAATLADPAKRAQHGLAFSVRVGGEPVYPREVADALQDALYGLVGRGAVERLSRHDTNPAENLPIPRQFHH